jgi:hypothetical protein
MGRQEMNQKHQSLGELIAALRPGDACPWCGVPLQSCSQSVHEAVLCCPKCGSEVLVEDGEDRACGRQPLEAAA